jgi:tetratricopeptide (TPR) repeat protein
MAKAKPQPQPTPQPKTPPSRSKAPSSSASDPGLGAFTEGLAALQAKDWQKAVERLEKAVELADRPEMRDKARQLLVIPRQKVEEKSAKAQEPEVDPFLTAVYEKNRGDLQAALEISRKGGRDQKDDRFAYLVASIHAVEDRLEEAAQTLAKAVELNPKNRIHAFHDPDFAELRKNRDYRPLFGLS